MSLMGSLFWILPYIPQRTGSRTRWDMVYKDGYLHLQRRRGRRDTQSDRGASRMNSNKMNVTIYKELTLKIIEDD